MSAAERGPQAEARKYTLLGLSTVGVLVVGLVAGGAVVEVAGAVVAPGSVAVVGGVQQIQHVTGGTITEILAFNGDEVNQGDPLVILDSSRQALALDSLTARISALEARTKRLSAEAVGAPVFDVPGPSPTDTALAQDLALESKLFNAGAIVYADQVRQLEAQVQQLESQMVGLDAQAGVVGGQISAARAEISRLSLLTSTPTVLAQIAELNQQLAAYGSQSADVSAQRAASEASIEEREAQIDQLSSSRILSAVTALEETAAELIDLKYQEKDLRRQIEESTISAPVSGTVTNSLLNSVGAVLAPGATVMEIVPSNTALRVEAHIAASDVDRVAVGQRVMLRFPALNSRTTPEVWGTIETVSANVTREAESGVTYYASNVELDDTLDQAQVELVTGMPAEVFVQTGDRSIFSYIFKPVVDQFRRAFIEE